MVEAKFSSWYDDDPPMVTARIVPSEEELRRVVEAVPLAVVPTTPIAIAPTAPTAPIAMAPVLPNTNDQLMQHTTSNQNGDGEHVYAQSSTAGVIKSLTAGGENNQLQDESTRKVSAGIAGAIVGLLFGGPIGAIILGFGTAYYTEKDGAAGDTARAMGDVALSARNKAHELDEKHHIVDKSKEAAHKAWEKAKEIDREHHIVEKTKRAVVASLHFLTKMVNQLMEKISQSQQENRTRTERSNRPRW